MQYTYDSLLSSIQNYNTDNSPDYITEYPNIVQLAQDRIIKDLNIAYFDTNQSISSASVTITKPSDMIAVKTIFVYVNSERQFLQQRTRGYIDYYWQNPGSVGTPKYYADNGTTQWKVAPTPDMSYTYQVNYIARLAYLTSVNQTNWLSTTYGELMLDATMIISKNFFREDAVTENGETKNWESIYAADLALAKRELILATQSSDLTMTPVINMVGITS